MHKISMKLGGLRRRTEAQIAAVDASSTEEEESEGSEDGAKKREKETNSVGKSQTSHVSALSFLSGGIKMLASKVLKPVIWFQPASRIDRNGIDGQKEPDAMSDVSFLDDTTDEERCFAIGHNGIKLWRRVRMIVHGAHGEVSGLAGTVQYRSARRLQCFVRQLLARNKMARRLADARAARQAGEELRLRRREREADAMNRYKMVCREEGRRARLRFAAYLKWLEDRARRQREYERYLAALAAGRAARDGISEQVKRRVWGRVEFEHTGWRPRYEVENPPTMADYIWTPPRGNSSGVRTLKFLLPPRSERERKSLTTDKNAWVGIPVGVAKRRPPQAKLGPSPRPGTSTAEHSLPSSSVAAPGGGGGLGHGVALRYNWLPAPLVAEVGLLQTPISK